MKFFVIFALVACVVCASVSATSVPSIQRGIGLADVDGNAKYDVSEGVSVDAPSRHKRFTCDVLSIEIGGKVKLNDAACGAHCFVKQGWRGGGYCTSKRACHCRK